MNGVEFAAAGANLALVAWLARHAKDVPTIVSGVEGVVAGATIEAKWTALKAVGDVIVADLGDFPGFTGDAPAPVTPPAPPPPAPIGPVGPTATTSIAAVDAALGAIGDGHIIDAITSLVTNPQFLSLVELILKLAGVTT
jgi:hypothetical protein